MKELQVVDISSVTREVARYNVTRMSPWRGYHGNSRVVPMHDVHIGICLVHLHSNGPLLTTLELRYGQMYPVCSGSLPYYCSG